MSRLQLMAERAAEGQTRSPALGEVPLVVLGIEVLGKKPARRNGVRPVSVRASYRLLPASFCRTASEVRPGLAHREDTEAGRVILEELRRVVRHLLHQFRAAVEHQQVRLRERFPCSAMPCSFGVVKSGREGVDVPLLETMAVEQPASDRRTRDDECQQRGDEFVLWAGNPDFMGG